LTEFRQNSREDGWFLISEHSTKGTQRGKLGRYPS
jgi:hypothetical protein